MNNEKWGDLKFRLEEKFPGLEIKKEERESGMGMTEFVEQVESLEFPGPTGPMKIERVSRPKVDDVKEHYHRRKSDAQTEYVLSDEQMTHRVTVYKWDEPAQDWVEADLNL